MRLSRRLSEHPRPYLTEPINPFGRDSLEYHPTSSSLAQGIAAKIE
jgi:hypothetical protein